MKKFKNVTFVRPDDSESVFNIAMENSFYKNNLKSINSMDSSKLLTFVKIVAQLGSEELLNYTIEKIEDKDQVEIILKELSKDGAYDNIEELNFKVLELLGLDIGDSPTGASPVAQVQEKVIQLKKKNRGISITSRGNFTVEPNTFAAYLRKRLIIVRKGLKKYGYIDGVYKLLEDIELRKICRDILNEVDTTIWQRRFEAEYINALDMELDTVDSLKDTKGKIAFENGYLNLYTGEFNKHSPDYFFTNKLNYKYDPNAKAPRFKQFLEEIFENDVERVKLMEEIMGYLLIEDRSIHKMYILKGSGANGKSVLLNVIEQILGQEKVSNTPLNRLAGKFGLQNLENKLVNISSENELGGNILDSENMKKLTGDDPVEIEKKHQDAYSADVYTRLVMSVNNDFTFLDTSHGMIRRLMFIPFNVRFHERPLDEKDRIKNRLYQDPQLGNKLLTEISGIFNIAYNGLKRLMANDYIYTPSEVCEAELKSYIDYLDPITAFIGEELVIDPEEQIKRTDINLLFEEWQRNNVGDYKRLTPNRTATSVKNWLEEKGHYVRDKKVSGLRYLEGIREKRMVDESQGDVDYKLVEEIKKHI